jgi:hypothetical protein
MKYRLFTILLSLALHSLIAQTNPEPAFDFLKAYPHVRDISMSKDKDEAYFTIQSPNEEIAAIAFVKKENGNWTAPQLVNFTGNYRDIEPFLSKDGLRLYFSSNRPIADTSKKTKDYDIWFVERITKNSDWLKPVNMGPPINTNHDEFYPSLSNSCNLYFTSDAPDSKGKDDIYVSKWDGKFYTKPVALDSTINSAGYEFNAFVSPNEDYLIFTAYARKDGLGSGDLYISFKDEKGNWQQAKNMGATINSAYMDYCPFVANDGILYFTSKRSTIKTQTFNNIKDFEKEINKYENGWSRIYKVSVNELKFKK